MDTIAKLKNPPDRFHVSIPKFAIHISFYSLVYPSNKIIPWQQSYYNPWYA